MKYIDKTSGLDIQNKDRMSYKLVYRKGCILFSVSRYKCFAQVWSQSFFSKYCVLEIEKSTKLKTRRHAFHLTNERKTQKQKAAKATTFPVWPCKVLQQTRSVGPKLTGVLPWDLAYPATETIAPQTISTERIHLMPIMSTITQVHHPNQIYI